MYLELWTTKFLMDGNGETPIFHEMIWFVIQLKQPIKD